MLAIRPPGETARPAVTDDQMRIERPVFFRHQLHQIEFDLRRIRVTRQAQKPVDADHVCVHRDPRDPERIPQNDIGRFSADSRDCCKIFHAGRHLPAEPLQDRFRGPENALCLVPVKPRTSNRFLDFARIRGGEDPDTSIFFEKIRRDPIHKLVRALGRENRCYQKLPGRLEMKGATAIRISSAQLAKNLQNTPPFSLKGLFHNNVL